MAVPLNRQRMEREKTTAQVSKLSYPLDPLCAHLSQSIPGAQRMVVGHTIQGQGINSACEGRVFRVDVGLSRGCGDGDPQV